MEDDKCGKITSMPEIQAADPKARRKLLIIVAGATVLGGFAILAFEMSNPSMVEWLLKDPDRVTNKINSLLVVFAVFALPALIAAVYLWRVGRSSAINSRYPPPGVAVIRDTPVVRGSKARTQGRLIQFLSLLLAAVAVGMPVSLWLIINSLLG